MIKKNIMVVILLMLLLMTGCGNSASKYKYTTDDGKGLFAIITVDNAGIITTETSCYHYYYLKDTKVVYVGYLSPSGIGQADVITPVITENGNYYRYDIEKKQVVEIEK